MAADQAKIELTFTGDETSFVGDREIIEGTASVTFSNESTVPVTLMAFGYDTDSAALTEELEFLEAGENGVPSGLDPVTPDFDAGLGDDFEPGSHTLTMDLQPGTYVFDAAPGDVMTTGIWRVAVIEVVAK